VSTAPSRPVTRTSLSATTPVARPGNPAGFSSRRVLAFVGHYLEMVAAMIVGMVGLAPLWRFTWPAYTDRVETHALVMALDMTVAMAAWMRLRRHSLRSIAVMSTAMCAPFAALLVPYRIGLITGDQALSLAHILMLALMALAMLLPSGLPAGHGH